MPRQHREMIPPVTQNPTPCPAVAEASRTAVPLAPRRSNSARNGSTRCTSAVSVTSIPVHPSTAVLSGRKPQILGVKNVVPHGFATGVPAVPIENSGVCAGKPSAGRTCPPLRPAGYTLLLPAPRHQNCTAGPAATLIVASIAYACDSTITPPPAA